MLGLDGQEVHQSSYGWSPVYVQDNLGVMSIGFLLPNPDDAVIWRGPRKNGIIKQFLKDTYWGDDEMDVLIVDAPPGTSDEHISIVQLLQGCRPGAASRHNQVQLATHFHLILCLTAMTFQLDTARGTQMLQSAQCCVLKTCMP